MLFDFDGVIADTEESNIQYLEKALASYGVILTDAERRSLFGVNEPSKIARFLERSNPPVNLETFRGYRKTLGNTYENGSLEPMPGLLQVLNGLRAKWITMALVSSTSTALIEAGLRRLNLTAYFDVVICGDMVDKRKPDPEPYQKAMELLGADPLECLIIEDSPVGIQAGKASGARVVGFRGSRLRQDVSQADFRIDTFGDFFRIPVFESE